MLNDFEKYGVEPNGINCVSYEMMEYAIKAYANQLETIVGQGGNVGVILNKRFHDASNCWLTAEVLNRLEKMAGSGNLRRVDLLERIKVFDNVEETLLINPNTGKLFLDESGIIVAYDDIMASGIQITDANNDLKSAHKVFSNIEGSRNDFSNQFPRHSPQYRDFVRLDKPYDDSLEVWKKILGTESIEETQKKIADIIAKKHVLNIVTGFFDHKQHPLRPRIMFGCNKGSILTGWKIIDQGVSLLIDGAMSNYGERQNSLYYPKVALYRIDGKYKSSSETYEYRLLREENIKKLQLFARKKNIIQIDEAQTIVGKYRAKIDTI